MNNYPSVDKAIISRLSKVNAVIKVAESLEISHSSKIMSDLLQRRDNLKKLFQEILRFERTINMNNYPSVDKAIISRLSKVNAVIKVAESLEISHSSKIMSDLLQRRDNLKKLFQEILYFERTINKA